MAYIRRGAAPADRQRPAWAIWAIGQPARAIEARDLYGYTLMLVIADVAGYPYVAAALAIAGLAVLLPLRQRLVVKLEASEAQRKSLVAAIVRAEEAERNRIASELHDDTVQVMTAVLLRLDMLRRKVDEPELENMQESLATALERTRQLMFELRPQILEAGGVSPAVEEVARNAAAELDAELDFNVTATRFDPAMEQLVFRTFRESILNARTHSGADHLQVVGWRADGQMHGLVIDNGRGFDVHKHWEETTQGPHKHLGLPAMFERIKLAGGYGTISSAEGQGTTLSFTIPL